MKTPEKWQSWSFVIGLLLIAFVINTSQRSRQIDGGIPSLKTDSAQPQTSTPVTRPEPVSREAEERIRVLREQETKRLQYIARYVRGETAESSGGQRLAVLVGTETKRFNSSVTTTLMARCRTSNAKATSATFTPEFLSDGLLQQVFNDPDGLVKKLDLAKVADALVLAYQEVDYVTNPELENVITANMRLNGMTVSIRGMIESRAWSYSANGAGFNKSDARRLAEERLLKQIEADAKFTSKVSP